MRRLLLGWGSLLIAGVLAVPASARVLPSITLDPTSACPGTAVLVTADPPVTALMQWEIYWDDAATPFVEGSGTVTPVFVVPEGAGYGSLHTVRLVSRLNFPPVTEIVYGPEDFTVRSLPQCIGVATIPTVPILTIPSADGDGDGVSDTLDNCPAVPNLGQQDADSDGLGDACDGDRDGDGVGNAVDAFPDDPTESADLDGDGVGDTTDLDRDGDGTGNPTDAYPNDPAESVDSDGDGTGDNSDNCPAVANLGQEDTDSDGVGDACSSPTPATSAASTAEAAEVTTPLPDTTDKGGRGLWWIVGACFAVAAIGTAFIAGRRSRR